MSDPLMDILDEFDRTWRDGESPDLASLIKRLRVQGDDELCVELCAADLEWRWRACHTNNTHASLRWQSHSPEAGIGGGVGPGAHDYASLLESLLSDRRHFHRMLEAEFLARSQWGDAPNVVAFLEESLLAARFNTKNVNGSGSKYENNIALHLSSQLDHLAQFRVGVLRASELLLNIRVPPQFEIGRQDRREPSPPVWQPETNRLVVARLDDCSLSRHQIQICRTGLHELNLTNTSRNVALTLDVGPLRPNESARISTPISILFNDLTVEIRTEA